MPLAPPWPAAAGVAAGVAGATWLLAFACRCCASFSDDGGVRSPAPPGNERDAGEVKAFACCAFEGWVVRLSMIAVFFRQGYLDVELLEIATETVYRGRGLYCQNGLLFILFYVIVMVQKEPSGGSTEARDRSGPRSRERSCAPGTILLPAGRRCLVRVYRSYL